ncbi:hypothetical protein PN498_03395 [Oscillatoria sp. CS-180]|nr:hypothetical protein [Oscillatoria sp. CS-180]
MRSPAPMILKGIQQAFAPTPRSLKHPKVRFWFCLTLAYAAMVAVLVWDSVSGEPYAIADDARQHVVWMLRFTDAELFSNDWIADYFQSVSPIGYAWLYRLFAWLGIPPLAFAQILPSILIVLTAITAFLACLELCALPATGFAAVAMLNQSVEFVNAVASGTSKAFVFLFALLFLVGWLRRSRWLTWLSIALQGLFSPQTVLIASGVMVLGLAERREGRWQIKTERSYWILTAGGLIVAATVILSYGLTSGQFGPTMTAEQALTMPEFFPRGRNQFFRSDLVEFLLYGRSGLRLDIALTPVTNLLALSLPILCCYPHRFPLVQTVKPRIHLFTHLLISALGWFFLAHMLLFKLHLPSRYTGRFFLLVLALAGGIALIIWVDALLRWAIAALSPSAKASGQFKSWLVSGLSTGLAIALMLILVLYPATMSGYPSTSVAKGREIELYQFLANQPKDSMVAGLSAEISNIPSFSLRSVLVSSEVSIPYHVGYYTVLRQRTQDVIRGQYTPDAAILKSIIAQYGITHWLLSATSFDVGTVNGDRWIQQYQPEGGQAISVLTSQQVPALQRLSSSCTVFQSDQHQLIDAQCLLSAED